MSKSPSPATAPPAPTQTNKNAGDAFSNRYAPLPTPKPSKNIGDFVSGQTVPNGVQVPKPTPSAEADESASNDTGDQHGKPKTGPGALIGDSSNPSQKGPASEPANTGWANPHPKKKPSDANAFKKQWSKTAGDAQGRFSVDFGPIKFPAQQTQTSHTSKVTKNYSVMPDNDDQHKKHKKHQHGHHHDDDQNQGND